METRDEEERRYFDWLEALARSSAMRAGFKAGTEDAEDCAGNYLCAKLENLTPADRLPTAMAATELEAFTFAKRAMWVRRYVSFRLVSIEGAEREVPRQRIDPNSVLNAPMERILAAELLDRLLEGAAGLPVERQRLVLRHIIDGERIVDLQAELGVGANLLYQWIHASRREIRKALEQNGLTEEEVNRYRAELAILRGNGD